MLTPDVMPHRLSVADVYRMEEVGILGPDQRVELLDGVLVDMSPPGPEHSVVVTWLTRHFVLAIATHQVRVQDMLLVAGGFVMPDVMVLDPPPPGEQPVTAVLVVEVSVTTQRHDTRKALRYARAGVDEYWLVDVPERTVRVHRAPAQTGYGAITAHRDADAVRPLLGGPAVELSVLFAQP